jgi:hypothetical protein
MTPQFLRAEAARFREMAEAITDREASKQRLLNMAIDYESRANAADEAHPPAPSLEPELVAESDPAIDVPARPKAGRKSVLRL